MRIEKRGFGITEISERVAGIDAEHGNARVVFVGSGGAEVFSPWLRPEDVKALIEALTAAYGLMTDETVTPPGAPSTASDCPASVTDGQGDAWYRLGNSTRYTADSEGRTLDYIRDTYGLRDGA